jgi:hypothetical protein
LFLVKLLPAPIRESKAGWHSVNAPGKARHQFEEVPEDDDALVHGVGLTVLFGCMFVLTGLRLLQSDGGEEIATDVLAGVAEATSDVKLDDSVTGANVSSVCMESCTRSRLAFCVDFGVAMLRSVDGSR